MRKMMAGVCMTILAGCSVGPDYVRPDIKSPEQWKVEYRAAEIGRASCRERVSVVV